jgi:hypothetical protein
MLFVFSFKRKKEKEKHVDFVQWSSCQMSKLEWGLMYHPFERGRDQRLGRLGMRIYSYY